MLCVDTFLTLHLFRVGTGTIVVVRCARLYGITSVSERCPHNILSKHVGFEEQLPSILHSTLIPALVFCPTTFLRHLLTRCVVLSVRKLDLQRLEIYPLEHADIDTCHASKEIGI
jgi:hypothetical protein